MVIKMKKDKINKNDIITELNQRIFDLKLSGANFTKGYRRITIEFYEKILKLIKN